MQWQCWEPNGKENGDGDEMNCHIIQTEAAEIECNTRFLYLTF